MNIVYYTNKFGIFTSVGVRNQTDLINQRYISDTLIPKLNFSSFETRFPRLFEKTIFTEFVNKSTT